jgi:hypothetical protein
MPSSCASTWGVIGGQVFVNTASFGAYAEVVQTPAYRGDKLATTLQVLPDLPHGHRGARLAARADGTQITAPRALLVANNPYESGDIAGLSRRARLDRGLLGVVGVTVASARQAAGPVHGTHGTGLIVLTAKTIDITADADRIPVGIDGEAVLLPAPVQCAIRPGTLRVWVPPNRPGIPRPSPGELGTAAPPGRAREIAATPTVMPETVALPDQRPSRQGDTCHWLRARSCPERARRPVRPAAQRPRAGPR